MALVPVAAGRLGDGTLFFVDQPEQPDRSADSERLDGLLRRAQEGDRAALDTFIRLTQHDVWAICRNLGDADNAEDLVQDVYHRVLRSIDRWRGDGPARHWVLTIARRTCADATRKRIVRRRHWADAVPEEQQSHLDPDRTVTDELLALLDTDRRDAFVLTQLAGCSYEDAATILDCPIGTVRSRVARARGQLIEALDDHGDQAGGASPA